MQGKHLSPADYIIHIFGGVRATARAIGRTPPTVSKWQRGHTQKGHKVSTGALPADVLKPILEKAKADNLDITAEDLILGRKVPFNQEPDLPEF